MWQFFDSITVFVACFGFRIFGCMHNLKQTYDSVLKTGVARGKGKHLSPGAAFWGRKLRLECHVTITKCQMSADASNYNLQNVECQSLIPSSCKISSRSLRFAKGAIANVSDVLRRRLCLSATSTRMWFDWRLCHNAFRWPGLRTFPLRSHSVVASQSTGIQHSQCMQLRMLFLEQR